MVEFIDNSKPTNKDIFQIIFWYYSFCGRIEVIVNPYLLII